MSERLSDQFQDALAASRKWGISHGIEQCIEALEKLRSTHNKRSSGYNDLSIAIAKLESLIKGENK